jgi:DNA repair protein RadD
VSAYALRPYQRSAADAGVAYLTNPRLRDRNGIIVAPTGSGKSLLVASIATALPGPCIVLQPTKEILEQNAAKLTAYGFPPALYSASVGRKEIGRITLATFGSVVKQAEAFRDFSFVLIDECFVAGTLVDGRPIESVLPGDVVTTYDHERGQVSSGRVLSTMKRLRPERLCRVTASGQQVSCTPNHPFFVEGHGYTRADSLQIGDRLAYWSLPTTTAPDSAVHPLRSGPEDQERGPAFLLSEDREGFSPGMRAKTGLGEHVPDYVWEDADPQGQGRVQRADEAPESDVQPADSREGLRVTAQDRTPSARSGRERVSDARGTAVAAGPTRRGMGPGIRGENRTSSRGVSALLQDRPGEPGPDDRGRDRRGEPQSIEASGGRTENGVLDLARVESVEVLERERPNLFGAGCAGDYVYNLEVAEHNNYFANGLLVHNCHQAVSPKGGMVKAFLDVLQHARILGFTATPFRLASNSWGSTLRFLTRTRPRIFRDVVHVTQIAELVRGGFLCPVQYDVRPLIKRDRLRYNSTGGDYTDASVQAAFAEVGFPGQLRRGVQRVLDSGRQHALVFTRFVDEAQQLAAAIPGAAVVTGETPAGERARILNDFKAGRIRVVANCAVLLVGFDFPELDAVVLASPTVSLARYYQSVGRGIRPAPGKRDALVVDLVGTVEQFGHVEDLVLEPGGVTGEKWVVKSRGRELTNCYYGDQASQEKRKKSAEFWSGRRGGQARSQAADNGRF